MGDVGRFEELELVEFLDPVGGRPKLSEALGGNEVDLACLWCSF